MPKPYSQDLRDRVISAAAGGMSARAASRLFKISESTGVKWVQRWRRTGSSAPKPMGGYKRSVLDSHADVVLGLIAERPDLTLEEILPSYVGNLHYYQRLFASALSRSMRASVTGGDQASLSCRQWQTQLPRLNNVLPACGS